MFMWSCFRRGNGIRAIFWKNNTNDPKVEKNLEVAKELHDYFKVANGKKCFMLSHINKNLIWKR